MTGKRLTFALYVLMAVAATSGPFAPEAQAGYYRQYYSGWSYRPRTNYYYSRYYYHSYARASRYSYHYVICYASRPRYRYYYNPVRRVYWGRFEFDESGKPLGYSMLKPEHRKENLEEIPDDAFPKPGKMPPIPDSKDGTAISAPPRLDFSQAKSKPLENQRKGETVDGSKP